MSSEVPRNQRLHRDTSQRPLDRLKPEALRPLPVTPSDYRESLEALVHKAKHSNNHSGGHVEIVEMHLFIH